jgi:F-type H+-transporting ATPase subunit a
LLAIEFPPISHLLNWPDFWFKGNEWFAVNKVALIMVIAAFAVAIFYLVAGSKNQLVPTGVQNIAEAAIDFVREGIIMETAGPDALPFMPLLLTLFSFIFALNLFEIIPVAQMPPNARIALPMFMAIVVWLVYNAVGMIKQGPLHYLKGIAFPPGVPKPIYLLVTPIELVSVLLVRPLSLAVRLFANLLAGHLILVSFAILADTLFKHGYIGSVAPFAMLVALTGFELLVAFLQAYIFTILTSVYIGGALHPDH